MICRCKHDRKLHSTLGGVCLAPDCDCAGFHAPTKRLDAMKRTTAIDYLRIAGYHGDRAAFTRLYVENRVSYEAAKKAYGEGQAAKARGVPCTCNDCKQPKEHTP